MSGPCSETLQYNTRCGRCADCILYTAECEEVASTEALKAENAALRERVAAAESALGVETSSHEHCRDAWNEAREKLAVAIAALRRVSSEHQDYSSVATSESEDSRQYSIGVVDGHRCAAGTARDTLKKLGVE